MAHRRWAQRGRHVETLVPVLAGYCFLEMATQGDPYRWHEVANLRGFNGFIGGEEPTPVTGGTIEALIARSTDDWILEDQAGHSVMPQMDRGTIVRLAAGHLENCMGVVEWTRYRLDGPVAQVRVTKFFGIDIRAEVPLEMLERVGKQEARRHRSLLDLPVLREV